MVNTTPNHREVARKVEVATTIFYNPNSESDMSRAGSFQRMIQELTKFGYGATVVWEKAPQELLRD